MFLIGTSASALPPIPHEESRGYVYILYIRSILLSLYSCVEREKKKRTKTTMTAVFLRSSRLCVLLAFAESFLNRARTFDWSIIWGCRRACYTLFYTHMGRDWPFSFSLIAQQLLLMGVIFFPSSSSET